MFCLTISLPLFLLLLPAKALIGEDEADDWALSIFCHQEDRANTLVLISHHFPVTFCSGTIISPSHVLTAAHCSSRKPLYVYPGLASKYLGLLKEEELNSTRVVEQHLHPEFNRKTLENDIAVFEVSPKFTLDFTYDGNIFHAWLPKSVIGDNPDEWDNCTKDSYIMGWSPSIVNSTTNVALCVRAPVMSNEECHSDYSAVNLKNRVCIKQTNRVCLSSGGAVICNGEQVGVISYVHCDLVHLPKDTIHKPARSVWLAFVAGVIIGRAIKALFRSDSDDEHKLRLDYLDTYGVKATYEFLEKLCKYFWRFCAAYAVYQKARIDSGNDRSRPYISVRTDTAIGFINDAINGRSAAESTHRLILPLLILVCAIFVMKNFQ